MTASGDLIDHALDEVNTTVNAGIEENQSKELQRLDDAIARIREGSYGVCEGCGQKISIERLNALSSVTTCIACARDRERSGVQRVMEQSSRGEES
ncbi:TraR/DksA C4-type zinc finger protein [Candidatus Peregrinibacteria bacterium]|nr:TraR/DksA C4-type zinc finger protein [Candidatus Peregrinibacteria bacterium]